MKLYVIVRKDLPTLQYKAVQGGHAVAQFMIDHPNNEWQNNTLIYVVVKNERALYEWLLKLEARNIEHSCFYEPDLDNELTAVACQVTDDYTINLNLLGEA